MTSYQDQNDYEDGDNRDVLGTGARQKLGYAKLVGRLSEAQTLRLSYEQRHDEGERAQRPQWIVSGFNPLYPLRTERETWTLNYGIRPQDNPLLDLELTAYHTQTNWSRTAAGAFTSATPAATAWICATPAIWVPTA